VEVIRDFLTVTIDLPLIIEQIPINLFYNTSLIIICYELIIINKST